jgi:hypothetical protein
MGVKGLECATFGAYQQPCWRCSWCFKTSNKWKDSHVKRSGNEAAHRLANEALLLSEECHYWGYSPVYSEYCVLWALYINWFIYIWEKLDCFQTNKKVYLYKIKIF